MKTARQIARQRRRRHRLMVGTTVSLAVAGVVIALFLVLLPDRETDGTSVSLASAAGTPARVTLPTDIPSRPGTPSATGSRTPKASAHAPSKRPSATTTPKAARAASTTEPSAGRIRPGTTYKGVATAYEAGDGDGACLFGPSDDMMIAAMNTTDYETSRACGAYVRVHAANGASITVRITNECPLPCAPGQLDLSRQAFAELADLKVGRIPISWNLVSPSTSRTVSIRYKTGSNPYWCAIQVIGHRNPVARLDVRTSGGWRQLPRTAYDYFVSADGSGCGSTIRITDVYGEQLTVSGIALRANVVQPTRVQFARH
ncbi:expansin EXLX1 family cellulose-binding protein [Streptomyces sp. NBC_00988]|uniref:expansin EXLX1 family cellulose-binding protein n=1 Tax=Streptomyces sp. NBC_00988 TaxID=2903704 RepID=UPI003866AC2B|nr:expansin EXLX1 family cellulose-binding protein [Streptomyces sp. NBC_00988]